MLKIEFMFQPVPGVTVEDMGHKMGLNGVDNAKLTFDQVRVPRENLLNKYSDITPEGEFVTKIEKGGPRARFLAMADQLVRFFRFPIINPSRRPCCNGGSQAEQHGAPAF